MRTHGVGDGVGAGSGELAGGMERRQGGHGVTLADGHMAGARVRMRQR